jgi:hypothetical protein
MLDSCHECAFHAVMLSMVCIMLLLGWILALPASICAAPGSTNSSMLDSGFVNVTFMSGMHTLALLGQLPAMQHALGAASRTE